MPGSVIVGGARTPIDKLSGALNGFVHLRGIASTSPLLRIADRRYLARGTAQAAHRQRPHRRAGSRHARPSRGVHSSSSPPQHANPVTRVSVARGLRIAGRLPNPALFERRRDTQVAYGVLAGAVARSCVASLLLTSCAAVNVNPRASRQPCRPGIAAAQGGNG